jgi:hypothetical protein
VLCALERKAVFSVLRGPETVSRPAFGKLSQDRLLPLGPQSVFSAFCAIQQKNVQIFDNLVGC